MFFPHPIFLFHKPTERCDCRCRFCDFWKKMPNKNDVLPTNLILSFLNQARLAGFTTYVLWGGEPLLVEDLPVWLAHAKRIGLGTMFCTSGRKLLDRAEEVAPHTDRLIISIEAIGKRHDELRGVPGLFDLVVKGLERFISRSHGEIIIWSHINRENRDEVESIAKFAQEFGVKVEFFPTTEYSGYNEPMILNRKEREEVFTRIIQLKKEGYPINNTWYALELMRSSRRFRCNIPLLSIQVYPDGEIYPCEVRMVPDLRSYGNIAEVDLNTLFASSRFQKEASRLSSCNNCLLPCVAHLADNLPLQGIRKVVGGILRINLTFC